VTDALFESIRDDLALRSGDQVLAMVSGLGATPQQELYIVFRRLHQLLTKAGMSVARQLVGNYVTSLDMAGCMVTLLRLDEELIQLWDEPVMTPALCW
jgi:dihydroxyacetone kinase-like protein